MKDYIILRSIIVRKDNIIFVNKIGALDIGIAINQGGGFSNVQNIQFENEENRDRAFNKLSFALAGDME